MSKRKRNDVHIARYRAIDPQPAAVHARSVTMRKLLSAQLTAPIVSRRHIVKPVTIIRPRRPEAVRSTRLSGRMSVSQMYLSRTAHKTVQDVKTCLRSQMKEFSGRSGTGGRKSKGRQRSRRQMFAAARYKC